MHVLRAEKGYPIIGQETDGTATPHDLGMDWIVSKQKRDFVGLRSFSRADTSRGDRKQLVGLLPYTRLKEGAHLVAAPGDTRSLVQPLRSIVHALRGWPTPMGVAINSTQQDLGPGPGIADDKARMQLEAMAGEVMEFVKVRQAGFQPAG